MMIVARLPPPRQPPKESPPEKEGKSRRREHWRLTQVRPSMKVPPKRKGNPESKHQSGCVGRALNESPSEKEGK